ncbi:MAG TPA: alcohol dehydrogenase catalytic domain-containing protein [Solirubrobacteraceae bacterium]|nr:alcohol dehydrogenase catalytic domain-containing protein [Solirubrobacteraceae bacterium]
MLHGPGDVRVERVPDPAGEVVVAVHAATTCGTDVKMWRHGHRILAPYPCAFGHETAGERCDTGERVLVSDSVACGACPGCRAGRPQICRAPTWILGGFAERIGAPAAALHALPDGLPAAGAAMAEPLAAALHAVARASDAEHAGVLGGGPMGLMLAALLRAEGRTVTLADPHPERREQAATLGVRATERLPPHALVFEAVGRPGAWRSAIEAAAPGAVVVLVGGCPPGNEVALPADRVHYEELDLRGSFHHSREEIDRALALLGDGTFEWSLLAGETIGLEDLPGALASPSGGRARKWIVDPRR